MRPAVRFVYKCVKQSTHLFKEKPQEVPRAFPLNVLSLSSLGPRGRRGKAYWSISLREPMFAEHDSVEPPLGSLGSLQI